MHNKEYMQQLWSRIETVIKQSNLLQKEFANSIGVDANQFSLAKSRCSEIRITTLYKIIDKYDVDANWLLKGEAQRLIDKQTLKELSFIETRLNDVLTTFQAIR